MRTTVTERGQTVIPDELRQRYQLHVGAQLEWIDTGVGIQVIPVPNDPIVALRRSGIGEHLLDRLLAERARDRSSG